MTAPPYMKLYIADYHVETTELDVVGHGAYLLLLMAMWRAGGKLPRDEGKLARLAKCTPEQWAAVRDDVMSHFKISGGAIRHARVAKEIAKYNAVVDGASTAGKTSAAKKANKRNKLAPTDVGTNVQRFSNQPEPELEPEKEGGGGVAREVADDWPEGNPLDALVEATASPWLDPRKTPGLVTTSGRIAAWRRGGASWVHDVLPVVAGLCQSRRESVATWKFFDPAIARSIAENRRALEIPEAAPRTQRGPSLVEQIGQERAEARRLALSRMEAANG